MSDNTDNKKTSYLPASGFTCTHINAYRWAGRLVNAAKLFFGEAKIIAGVWAYREQSREFLSCDLYSDDNHMKSFPITICAEGKHYFPEIDKGGAEADVFDMAEALHLAGIIINALDAKITVGRIENETNESVIKLPFSQNQTNGLLDLSFTSLKAELAAKAAN